MEAETSTMDFNASATLINASLGILAHDDFWAESYNQTINNNSSNNTTASPGNPDSYHIPLAEKIVEGGLLALVCFVAITGNTCLWCVVLGNRSLRNAANWLILCLSAADLLVSVVNMPLTIVTIFEGRWIFDDVTCVATGFTNMVTFIASVMSLGTISINRYVKVCCSSSYSSLYTPRNVALMAAGVWLLSISLATPPLIGWGVYGYLPNQSFCFCDWTSSVSYTFFMVGTCFGGPCTAMSVSYVLILRTYRRSKKKIRPDTRGSKPELPSLSKMAALDENSDSSATNSGVSALLKGKTSKKNISHKGLRRSKTVSLPCSRGCSKSESGLYGRFRMSLRVSSETESSQLSEDSTITSEEPVQTSTQKPTVIINRYYRDSSLRGNVPSMELNAKVQSTGSSMLSVDGSPKKPKNISPSTSMKTPVRKTNTANGPVLPFSVSDSKSLAESGRGEDIASLGREVKASSVVKEHCAISGHGQSLSCLPDFNESSGLLRTSATCRNHSNPCDNLTSNSQTGELASSELDVTSSPYSASPSEVRQNLIPEVPASSGANTDTPTASPAKMTSTERDEAMTLTAMEKNRRKEDRRLTLTLLVIILVFVVAWFPFCVTMFLSVFLSEPLPRPPDFFSLFLGYANSACNPIIYGFCNVQFRTGYKKLFLKILSPFRACARLGRDSVSSQTSSSCH